MSPFLLLNFLLLIRPSFQIPEGDTFLINHEKYNLCMQPRGTSVISLSKCNKDTKIQNFKWTSSQQILNMGLKLCLGASANFSQLEFSSCNQTNELQKWACINDTFPAIIGQNWFLSYGPGQHVRLNNAPDVKATWKIDGTKDSLCAKGFEAQFTIDGNSYGAPCVFPFKYENEWYVECITDSEHPQPWCGTTADVDKDSLTGYCPVKDSNDDLWIRNHLTGIQYQINSESALTWLQARKSCQQQNAELLSITELHEQTYLAATTGPVNTEYWIGLNSLDMDSGWQWVGNHPFRYLNWAPGSPSPESEKICATMQSRSGKWVNKECDHKLGYICRKENSSLNTPVVSSDDLKPVKCPDGWVPYSGHCYLLHKELKLWNRALSACRKEDGDLASIHNIEEHSFVISQLGYKPTDVLWIGLNAQKIEHYFEWSDGTRVTFTKWQPGEPTYIQESLSNCVVMRGENGYWMDAFCQEEFGYICKRKPLEILSKAEDVEPGCQKGWKRHGFYCYLIGQTLQTFSEAKKSCEGNKGSLVFINDRYEQAYLTSLVGLRSEKYFWIGISEIKEGWTLNWTNGDSVLFNHWNSGMPGQKHGCVAMRTGTAAGLWDVVSCDEKVTFLCKQWAEGVTTTHAPTTASLPPCPVGWSGTETSSSCFKEFTTKKSIPRTWFEARDFCREIGGDLASIHSEEDQNKISRNDEIWIGLTILDSDVGRTWSDGSPIDYEYRRYWYSHSNDVQQCATSDWRMSSCLNLNFWACQVKRGVALKAEPNDTFAESYKLIEDGWVKYEDNEYYFHNATLPMEGARRFCKRQGGDLAVITSEKERIFLWKYNFLHAFKSDVYIGLIVGLDEKFRWLDGTLVTYAAWAPNEPNNANEEELCVEMYRSTGLWNDIYCNAEKSFICERHNSSIRTTSAPTSHPPEGGCSEGWLLFNNKCFQIFGFNEEERKNWTASRTDCKSQGGNLATIPSKAVQAFLTMHLQNMPVDAWIGLHDRIEEGKFLWTDGSSMSYTNWVNGAPGYSGYRLRRYNHYHFHIGHPTGDCVAMIKKPEKWAGNWKDRLCSIKYGYICQKNTDPASSSSETTSTSDHISYGNSSYVFTEEATWEEARKECHLKHLELTSILNPYSQSFLWLQVLKYGEPMWIGLNSNVTNESYKWVSGWKLVYANWAPGEPKENLACVYLDLDGHWKTGACNKKFLSVCEQYNGVLPTDLPQVPGRCPEPQQKSHAAWIPFRAHCYIIISDQINWPLASMKCSQLGGFLTSIEDLAEQKFLTEHIEHLDQVNFWIGFLKNVDGEWIWQDNTAVDFVNWNTGEPRNYSEANYFYYFNSADTLCVAVGPENWKWFARNCHIPSDGYICKAPKIIEAKPTEGSSNHEKAKKEGAPPLAHGILATVVMLVLLILAGAGIAGYIFYKRRYRRQLTIAGFDNSLYHDNTVMLQNNDS
ncbi:macrophage mannose receptor 1-like [Eublepharis macularius]|uniref:Macrophage mannose receptor 1-like n=1 Tax=Eublepharis macularius TaxID=481883 RepID=A0AA97LA29_EUBMA|nr:macrophage mannose receptor 1-like [Eublepharis macularius]